MNKLVIALIAFGLFTACKSGHKKPGAEAVTFEEFREQFVDSTMPYKLTPEMLEKKASDSTAISAAQVAQFLTDTLAKADYPAKTTLSYYPLVALKGKEVNFVLIKVTDKTLSTAYLCFIDKKDHYLGRMRVARAGNKGNREYFSLDTRQMIKVTNEKELSPGHTSTKEDFYAVDAAGKTSLIMTNSTGETAPGQIFNPIDTLPRKNKLSGDYTSGDLSIVSIRDGRDPKSFEFFITFAKESGCKGELSGTGHFTGANKGEFTDKETDCGIAFQFSGGRVVIKEMGGCGAYRGIRCFFEGGYTKKKEEKK